MSGRVPARHDLLFAIAIAVVLAGFGIATHGGLPPVDATSLPHYPSDSHIYLSMAAGRWVVPGLLKQAGPEWSIYDAPLPFRYRILVPGLARLLPFGPVFSLALVNYLSLAGAYVFLLLTCRRLNMTRPGAAIGLAVAFTFVSHVSIYSLPWLTDGFILLVLSALTYAFVVDAFWLFAAWGLIGIFAREVSGVLLPLWCLRSIRRGAALTVIALLATGVERLVLFQPVALSDALHPGTILDMLKDTVTAGPAGASFWPPKVSRQLVNDILSCWGWAFAVVPIGLSLLPRESRRFFPVAAVLIAAAFGMSLIATDISREFMVLFPVVVIAAACLADTLIARGHIVLVALLLVLAAMQFCLSEQNIVFDKATWTSITAHVPMIKLGTLWAAVAAIVVRAELASRFRDHFKPVTEQPF